MLVGSFVKLFGEVKDYTLDWSDELLTDTISTSVWSIEPTTSPPLVEDSETNDTTTTTIWLSGGMVGEDYTLTNIIVTAAGRTCEATIQVRVSYLVAGETSYSSLEDLDDYHAKSQSATWMALAASAREGYAIRATRLFDRQSWLDDYDTLVKRVAVPDIVNAFFETALSLADGSTVETDQNNAQKLQSIKAGSVALTYFRGAEGAPLRFTLAVTELLKGYLAGTGVGAGITGVATGTDGESVTDRDLGYNRGI